MDRQVRMTKKDRAGKIVALCNPGQPWSPRRTADVIKDINGNKSSYYVKQAERRKYVRVISGTGLVTTNDAANENNLDNLPTV
ncbi:MAG: DUF3892 domain-containing protein [Polyangiaceae bacterium]|nr:DUF3892 domain-containing protein [Polyangiaceae bacterium]MCE7889865.1 DUF3892 domain-containing protein [Sorangiineae bacterium PRO1]MCL4752465.1 hypothetical protein [Myxococcales bacterium]